MKKILLFIMALGLAQVSCSDDDGASLSVSTNTVELDPAGTGVLVEVQTNESIWRVVSEADWVTIERHEDGNVTLGAQSNSKKQERSARVAICAGDRYERITVTQAPSLRSVGDAYPDAAAPIGMLYKISDGGYHGFVVSLDMMQCAWGTYGEAHEGATMNAFDGRANTRKIIEAHKDAADFETAYPAYHWVYEKNGRDLDGGWYIPAFWELVEMRNTLTGNSFTAPAPGTAPSMMQGNLQITHNMAVRDDFNTIITSLGGTPVEYGNVAYWSSTEANGYNAYRVAFASGFYSGSATMTSGGKTNVHYVRAVYEF